jgi:hypothetical protein
VNNVKVLQNSAGDRSFTLNLIVKHKKLFRENKQDYHLHCRALLHMRKEEKMREIFFGKNNEIIFFNLWYFM